MQSLSANELHPYITETKRCLYVCILYCLCSRFWRSHCYNAFSVGEQPPPPNTWFLGPTQVNNPNGMSIYSVVFAGLMLVSNKHKHTQTDRLCYICSNQGCGTGTGPGTGGTTRLRSEPEPERLKNHRFRFRNH